MADDTAIAPKARLHQITPFVPCTSLRKQIDFYCDVLKFSVTFNAENYAFLRRDAVGLRLVEVYGSVDLKAPERENSFYVDVENIDALYESLKPALSLLAPERVRVPFNQPYGQREFHVADEDCTLVFFGEAIASD